MDNIDIKSAFKRVLKFWSVRDKSVVSQLHYCLTNVSDVAIKTGWHKIILKKICDHVSKFYHP